MAEYYHSVTLDKDKCKGCTNCIKRCPTEAIRVRDGKARIIDGRCIDCGECIRVCPYHAKVAVTDPFSALNNYRYNIALPAPSLYGQFKNFSDINKILVGLKMMGFDSVYEVARAADYAAEFIKMILKQAERKKPIISSACPAIVRLVQIRFPELINNIANVESPMEIAAQLARKEFCAQNKFARQEEVGVFFITPCAAKMTSVKNPLGKLVSSVNGAISIVDIYGLLSNNIKKANELHTLQKASFLGVAWANSGGESASLSSDNHLAVDGIQNVIRVLEEIENNKFTDLDFFEGLACTGGCVGGPLVFENSFVAKNRIKRMIDKIQGEALLTGEIEQALLDINIYFQYPIEPKPVMQLDDDIVVAIRKIELIEKIHSGFPGLDCGSCGSPSCRTLAEDIVRGNASDLDCIFKLREKVKKLAQEMVELSEKIPGGEDDGYSENR